MNNSRAWYQKENKHIFDELQTSPEGLTSADAEERLKKYGLNELRVREVESIWSLLFRQINNPLIYVLLGSAFLAMVMGKLTDGFVVLGVVIVNAVIGFVQEYRSSQEIAALKNMVPDETIVLRDKKPVTLNTSLLVPGDILLFQSGDNIPADVRLFEVRSFRIIESTLTGESSPVNKISNVIEDNVSLGDRKNMAFNGTSVVSGTAKAIVVQTGSSTELGKIDTMLAQTQKTETPLTRSIASVARGLSIVIMIVAAALFGIALWRGYPLVDATLAAITLAVAAIPEGIPAIITIALAIGVRRMALRRAVIRHLPAVETLGSTTVICSDKTGTITRNEMTVKDLWTLGESVYLTGSGYEPSGKMEVNGKAVTTISESMGELLEAGVLCNDAHLRMKEGRWGIEGDPTEGALLTSAQKAGIDTEDIRKRSGRIDSIPFESDYKFMATLNEISSQKRVIYLKGAPEVIFSRCVLSLQEHDRVQNAIKEFAGTGKRVLAFARKITSGKKESISFDDVKEGLEFIGLQAMIDPPREEARAAIVECRDAGIRVKMITGDHQTTAASIGEQLGIMTEWGSLAGMELDHLDDAALQETASNVNIFARVAPEHKIKLVSALQSRGEVVAMTGDGVNDAPALKRADIGVAMGITGTDVSKDSADIILTDDNFATIVSAVEEGRRVYDNLIKSLAFALPTNLGEAMILLVAVTLFPVINGVPLLPMTPVQILWINLVATVSLALPLAFENKEKDIMSRPPRRPGEPLLNRFVLFRTVIVALIITGVGIGLFLHTFNTENVMNLESSIALMKAQTMAVTSIIFLQIFYMLNCRSLQQSIFTIGLFSNRAVIYGISILLTLQIGYVYIPFMNNLFGSSPISLAAWAESALFGAVVLPIISIEKMVRGHRRKRGLKN